MFKSLLVLELMASCHSASFLPDLLSVQRATEASLLVVNTQLEDVQSSQDPQSMPVLGFLKELPNRRIPHNTANNLTQVLEDTCICTHMYTYNVHLCAIPKTHHVNFLTPRLFSKVWKKCCPLQACQR